MNNGENMSQVAKVVEAFRLIFVLMVLGWVLYKTALILGYI